MNAQCNAHHGHAPVPRALKKHSAAEPPISATGTRLVRAVIDRDRGTRGARSMTKKQRSRRSRARQVIKLQQLGRKARTGHWLHALMWLQTLSL